MTGLSCTRALLLQAIHEVSYSAGSLPKLGSFPFRRTAPRLAERAAGVSAVPAAAEYRPCSAVSRDGVAFVARIQEAPSSIALPRARPNPSLNHRTPNGGLSWPGLGYAVHFPSPGQAIPPQGSG